MSFVKIHAQMFESSIMEAPALYRLVWFYMLMACDKNGNVYGTTSALSRRFNLSEEKVIEALAFLEQEDPNSTTIDPEFGGKRIVYLGNNLRFIVNYLFYRGLRDPDEERLKARERKRKSRSKKDDCHAGHKNVTECHDKAEAEAEAEYTSPSSMVVDVPASPSPSPRKKRRAVGYSESFEAFWRLYPRQEAKKPASIAWEKLSDADKALAMLAIPKHAALWAKEGREKKVMPHASTWLNQERWTDEIEDASHGSRDERDLRFSASVLKVPYEEVKRHFDIYGVIPGSIDDLRRNEVPF